MAKGAWGGPEGKEEKKKGKKVQNEAWEEVRLQKRGQDYKAWGNFGTKSSRDFTL